MKKRRTFSLSEGIIVLVLSVTAIFVLLPLLYVVSASLTSYTELLKKGGIVLFPTNPTLEGYVSIIMIFVTLANTFVQGVFVK